MFLVKKLREEKKRGRKKRISDIFSDLQRLTAPVTNWIKGQWRFSALLWHFLVVLLSKAMSFLLYFLWYIMDKCLSEYSCGLKIMLHAVKA